MASEDTKVVKKIEAKAGGKSGTYWSITWQDGKKDNIFDKSWLPLLEQSKNDNILLHFTKEKKGDYYNIVSLGSAEIAEVATLPDIAVDKPEVQIRERQHGIAPQEKGMWWKEVGECFRMGLFKKDDNAAGSYLWREYVKQMLASLEITIPKQEVKKQSKLVEEAKNLGAKEIEKEENQ